MYTEITRNIRIGVNPQALEHESQPDEGIYAFAYTITIENLGAETVQLIDRHWIIESDGRPLNEVKGSGVVGLQPILEQGQQFQYTSSAVINHPVGAMVGTYTMRSSGGTHFPVQIPKFELIYMAALH